MSKNWHFVVKMFLTLARVSKSVLITGANEGLGFCTALALAAKNHRIIMADKADLALSKSKIVKKTGNCDIVTKFVDFTSLTCVRNLAQEIVQEEEKLDVLINNVGVFCLGKERTVDGLQATMQVNHFGPFLLTHLLADLLAKSAPSRVIFVSSLGAFFNNLTISNVNNPDVSYVDAFSSLLVYYNSKLCNMIVSNGFAQRFSKEEITFNSVHPGMSATTFLWKNKPVANPFQCFLVLKSALKIVLSWLPPNKSPTFQENFSSTSGSTNSQESRLTRNFAPKFGQSARILSVLPRKKFVETRKNIFWRIKEVLVKTVSDFNEKFSIESLKSMI
ncbi:retinol dehydrogenase 14 isoform X1 [Tribolium castaneum]|uniref:retinol dehydrogenase 14 isoform X1 n=1 Tax=Tribolium castaneum TaxID=7070 RepID=UPI0030FEEF40